jgi:hypothetical protein
MHFYAVITTVPTIANTTTIFGLFNETLGS